MNRINPLRAKACKVNIQIFKAFYIGLSKNGKAHNGSLS